MTTVRVPTLVRDAVIDMLAGVLAQSWPTLRVRATVPEGWTPEAGSPLLIVSDDGSTGRDWPVATIHTIRLTSWTRDHDPELLNRALGACLACPIAGVDRARPGTWPLSATDTTTKAHLVSGTVLLTARTEEKEL